jgi:hypothetical protein
VFPSQYRREKDIPKKSRQIVYAGEKLDAAAVWRVRDEFFPPKRTVAGSR